MTNAAATDVRPAIEAGREPDMAARLFACGLRYREFALANPNFYARPRA